MIGSGPDDIETDRLLLRLVPLDALASTAKGDAATTSALMQTDAPAEWFADAWVFGLRHQQWLDDLAYAQWSYRAILLKSTGTIIGCFNCHDIPKPFLLHGRQSLAVEIGYTIFAQHRRNGYATETVQAFTAWAKANGATSFILSISPDNIASNSLALKLGATKIGSQIDERDGPENVFHFEHG